MHHHRAKKEIKSRMRNRPTENKIIETRGHHVGRVGKGDDERGRDEEVGEAMADTATLTMHR